MKINRFFIGLCVIAITSVTPAMSQNKKERKQRTEQAVAQAIEAQNYKISINQAIPMNGRTKHLTSNYSIEVRNDSIYSYLPYFGVAYNVPYGGGQGLIFNEAITEYTTKQGKKGDMRIKLQTRNNEDSYLYNITIFPNGSTSVQVTPQKRQPISYSGEMEVDLKE